MDQYSCIKCNHNQYETGEFRATGGALTNVIKSRHAAILKGI